MVTQFTCTVDHQCCHRKSRV